MGAAACGVCAGEDAEDWAGSEFAAGGGDCGEGDRAGGEWGVVGSEWVGDGDKFGGGDLWGSDRVVDLASVWRWWGVNDI